MYNTINLNVKNFGGNNINVAKNKGSITQVNSFDNLEKDIISILDKIKDLENVSNTTKEAFSSFLNEIIDSKISSTDAQSKLSGLKFLPDSKAVLNLLGSLASVASFLGFNL